MKPINNRKTIAALLLCLCAAGAVAQGDRPSVALVLSGGEARGFAHIAVLEIIEELGIPLDMIAGVSSGAIVGGLYAAGYSPAMILEALADMDWASFFNDRPVSPFRNRNEELPLALSLGGRGEGRRVGPVWGRGLSTGQMAYRLFKSLTVKIPSHIDFDSLPTPFRAGVVEVPSGDFKLLEAGDLAEAIRASMGIQGVFEPFIIDGRGYGDGALLNNLPAREMREMGFDIVIAVDLFAPRIGFSASPMDMPELISALYQGLTGREHHKYADVVLFPLPVDAPLLGFDRGREIHALAAGERETIIALLEPIRQKVLGENPAPQTARLDYRDMPYLAPRGMTMQGALPRDRSYIERAFSSLIQGRPLQAENLTAFLERIYETGNYRAVNARTDTRGGETHLELILRPETQNRVLLRAGLDYAGVFSYRSSGRTAIRSGVEFLGRDGFSLLLESSVMDELSVGLSMLRPLSPRFFVAAEADLVRDQTVIAEGILDGGEAAADRLVYFRGSLKGGLRFNRHNSLTLRPEYFRFRDEDQWRAMAGVAAAYTYSSLNHALFPMRGFRGRVDYRLRFAPGSAPFNLLAVDLTAAVPAGRRFSVGASGYASSLFGATELPPGLSTFGLDDVHRRYFPHARGVFCGERRAALSFALQFEPRESLHLLGGRMVFSMTGSAGRFGSFEWSDWDSLSENELVWNAAFGVAIVPLRVLGVQLRAGAGGGGGHRPAPFASLDVGMSGLRRGLF